MTEHSNPRPKRYITRRQLLRGVLAVGASTAALGAYAVAEPWRLVVTRYTITPAGWPKGLSLRCAVIADLHACEPWMGAARIRQIVARTNALAPDVTLLLGDYVAGRIIAKLSGDMANATWAAALAGLKAPLGVHAVLGNHDWWQDVSVQLKRSGPVPAAVALEAVGINVYDNQAIRLEKDGQPFWIAGLGDQWAYWPRGALRPTRGFHRYEGVDDLPSTLRQVTDTAPVILMAHEPDVFPEVPDRVAVTISGHTHGGQVTFAGYAPIVPSRYGRRYVYGHIVEGERNLVVSGGLGCSGLPIRFGRPPEIVVIDLGSEVAT
ncbi:MAG: metallophosphoesterase [Hyphomicrobium aestuarii]|nr:metallophosphoesterase [Hyphomicrobium aestuarii]